MTKELTKELLVNGETKEIVLARLDAMGLNTITAFSSTYNDAFPDSLDGIISRKEFKFCIDVINQTLEDYYPCVPCYACGYFCCVVTMGLSLLVPEPCTKELETNVDIVLRRINNREEFLYRGIIWRLHRSKRTHASWIEICQLIYD